MNIWIVRTKRYCSVKSNSWLWVEVASGPTANGGKTFLVAAMNTKYQSHVLRQNRLISMHESRQNLFANFWENQNNQLYRSIDPECRFMWVGVIQRLNVLIQKQYATDRVARLAAFKECKSRKRLKDMRQIQMWMLYFVRIFTDIIEMYITFKRLSRVLSNIIR
jgi:hypothetical protein